MAQYPAAVFLKEDTSRGLHKNTAYFIHVQKEPELYKVTIIQANRQTEPLVYKSKMALLREWDLVYQTA